MYCQADQVRAPRNGSSGAHHTISTPLVYALHAALSVIDEETMAARSAGSM